jgi:nucleoside-diphosphate-sugar epimerase
MLFGITGGRGTLGKILQTKLQARGLAMSLFEGDVCDSQALVDWLQKAQPQCVIHFAAMVPTQSVQQHPEKAKQVNVGGTENLVKAMGTCASKPWLFYASSSHVYRAQSTPIKESDPIEPLSLYGQTKWGGEQAVQSLAPAVQLKFCIGRIFSFYHASQQGSFLYPTLQRRLATEDLTQPFKLMGADDVRDLSNAEDIVEQVLQLAQLKAEGVYNLGSGKGTKIRDFVQAQAPCALKIENATPGAPSSLVADMTRLRQRLAL